jgi:hypothetical protein
MNMNEYHGMERFIAQAHQPAKASKIMAEGLFPI